MERDYEGNRQSFDMRNQLRDTIMNQIKQPKMPIYFEDREGPRLSLLSEMV